MEEIWKIYHLGPRVKWEVSNKGNVKRNGIDYQCKINSHNGYYRFGGIYLHGAVAELFVPNPENKPCVDHINGDKHDNRAVNLRWVTYKENNNNPITKERQKIAQNKPEQKQLLSILTKLSCKREDVKLKRHNALLGNKRSKDHKWMTNGIDRVCCKKELIDYYLSLGYHFGRK